MSRKPCENLVSGYRGFIQHLCLAIVILKDWGDALRSQCCLLIWWQIAFWTRYGEIRLLEVRWRVFRKESGHFLNRAFSIACSSIIRELLDLKKTLGLYHLIRQHFFGLNFSELCKRDCEYSFFSCHGSKGHCLALLIHFPLMMLFNGHDQACKFSARPTFRFRFYVQSLRRNGCNYILPGSPFFRRLYYEIKASQSNPKH